MEEKIINIFEELVRRQELILQQHNCNVIIDMFKDVNIEYELIRSEDELIGYVDHKDIYLTVKQLKQMYIKYLDSLYEEDIQKIVKLTDVITIDDDIEFKINMSCQLSASFWQSDLIIENGCIIMQFNKFKLNTVYIDDYEIHSIETVVKM